MADVPVPEQAAPGEPERRFVREGERYIDGNGREQTWVRRTPSMGTYVVVPPRERPVAPERPAGEPWVMRDDEGGRWFVTLGDEHECGEDGCHSATAYPAPAPVGAVPAPPADEVCPTCGREWHDHFEHGYEETPCADPWHLPAPPEPRGPWHCTPDCYTHWGGEPSCTKCGERAPWAAAPVVAAAPTDPRGDDPPNWRCKDCGTAVLWNGSAFVCDCSDATLVPEDHVVVPRAELEALADEWEAVVERETLNTDRYLMGYVDAHKRTADALRSVLRPLPVGDDPEGDEG